MGKYEVVVECYVPVGSGFRYKRPGQVVTLSDDDAASLDRYIKSVGSDDSGGPDEHEESAGSGQRSKRKRVAKRNTEPEEVEQPAAVVEWSEPVVEWAGEVTSDVGDPQAGDE